VNYYITVNLTEEQKRELKAIAAREGKTVKQLVRELIINKLEGRHE